MWKSFIQRTHSSVLTGLADQNFCGLTAQTPWWPPLTDICLTPSLINTYSGRLDVLVNPNALCSQHALCWTLQTQTERHRKQSSNDPNDRGQKWKSIKSSRHGVAKVSFISSTGLFHWCTNKKTGRTFFFLHQIKFIYLDFIYWCEELQHWGGRSWKPGCIWTSRPKTGTKPAMMSQPKWNWACPDSRTI